MQRKKTMHSKMLILFIDIETTGCCFLCLLPSFETYSTKRDSAMPRVRPRFQVCTPTSTTSPSWPSRTPRRPPPHPTLSKCSTCSARATTTATTRTFWSRSKERRNVTRKLPSANRNAARSQGLPAQPNAIRKHCCAKIFKLQFHP